VRATPEGEGEEAMKERSERRCADCGARAPKTQTNFTLIRLHGWRLTRGPDDHGRMTMDLRCRSCWARHRASAGVSGTYGIASAKNATLPTGFQSRDGDPKKKSSG
jgi:hypothetical protein